MCVTNTFLVLACLMPFTNIFSLGDLLLQKNKQKLLIQIYSYMDTGISIEEIVGVLLWQTKSLVLSQQYTEKESGLKSYVYNKCKKSVWNKDDSLVLYKNLLYQYHESRLGGLNLQKRIELLLLEI